MPESHEGKEVNGASEKTTSTQSSAIPIRYFRDESELPNNISYSLGGTIYGTTPGGSRIIYSRETLLRCRDSPLAKTPPKFLNDIPEEILRDRSLKPSSVPNGGKQPQHKDGEASQTANRENNGDGDADMFEMDED